MDTRLAMGLFDTGLAEAVALVEEIKAPMSETKEAYLFEEDEDIARMYQFDAACGGKWMLFLELADMDSMWERACKLYRLRQFPGITSIKSSTAKPKPLGYVSNLGVISFHCGPSYDKGRMMSYGQNIVDALNFTSRAGHISYKTDFQTLEGNRTTGKLKNSLYQIPVPKGEKTVDRRRGVSSPPYYRTAVNESLLTRDLPTKTFDRDWIHESNYNIAEKYPCELAYSGYWVMVFNKAWLDKKWLKACKLYQEGELTGINSLRVSTAKQFEGKYKFTGTILFYCGPSDDLELVRSYGENLDRLMNYFDNNGQMSYKSDNPKQTLFSIEVLTPWRPVNVETE